MMIAVLLLLETCRGSREQESAKRSCNVECGCIIKRNNPHCSSSVGTIVCEFDDNQSKSKSMHQCSTIVPFLSLFQKMEWNVYRTHVIPNSGQNGRNLSVINRNHYRQDGILHKGGGRRGEAENKYCQGSA
jgi:hypothetical protein